MKKTIKQPVKKLRIAMNTNSPFTFSGYAQTANEIFELIHNEGYPLAMLNFYGQEGYVKDIGGIVHYPKLANAYGDDSMVYHARDFKADIVISNQDSWTLDPNLLRQVNRYIPWVPIDHDPVPPSVVERMRLAYRVIACARFGQEQLRNHGINATYIPYSVNTDIFKPLDKIAARKKFGIPQDAFVFGMVAANKDLPPRKSFQEVLDAFQMFVQKHPNSFLYLNVPMQMPGGFPILEYAKFLGIADKLFHNEDYNIYFKFDKKAVAEIINTFDVSLNPSMSEGFGLNVIEAQACGVPIITNNFTSMPELIIEGITGWTTKVVRKRFTHMLSFVGEPDTQDLYDKMELSFAANREAMGVAGRQYIKDNYDTKRVFEDYWKPYLAKLEKEIYPEEKGGAK
jgi:glycosyltransferase involved in cell wall biosynthesis